MPRRGIARNPFMAHLSYSLLMESATVFCNCKLNENGDKLQEKPRLNPRPELALHCEVLSQLRRVFSNTIYIIPPCKNSKFR
jgi:hypothetical protein